MSRHSSFSRSSAPRSWRSMSKPATAAVPSVSFVFAEPEHATAPDGSAAALLSPRQPSGSELESPEASPPRRRDAASSLRKASFNSLNTRAKDAADADTTFDNRNTEDLTITRSNTSPMPDGNSNPALAVPERSSQRSGWFGSRGRKLQRESRETVGPAVAEDAVSSIPDSPQASPPNVVPFPTAPTPVPKPKASTGGWFSSSPTPAQYLPIDPTPPPRPTSPTSLPRKPSPPQEIPQPRTTTTTGWFTRGHVPASSVDDTVPTLAAFPDPPVPPEPASVRPRTRADSNLSSLNPSTSRFTLAIPLLGRPKVPLEKALQVQSKETESVQAAEPEPERLSPPPPPPPPPSENSSWWGYVGLGSSSSVALPQSLPPAPSTTESKTSPTPAAGVPTPEAPPEEPEAPLPSIHSADAPSTWYTPWRWYTGPETAPPPGKTQAELVKEAALARLEPPPPQSEPQQEPPPPPPPSNPNPVLATSESRASWASFFASAGARSRAVKETGEMEVMHVDDEDAPPAGSGSGRPSRSASPTPSLPKAPAPPLTKNPPSPLASRPESPTKKPTIPSTPASPRVPNLILPSFDDTFLTPPRSAPVSSGSTLRRALRWMLSTDEEKAPRAGDALPRLWTVLDAPHDDGRNIRRVVVVGIHGWFPGSLIRQVLGEPTGTSTKFAGMMAAAVEAHFGGVLEKLTQIVLEGEGTIEQRVSNLYQEYLKNAEWVEDLQNADAILIATHSQGSIVSTQLIDRLIQEGHIRTHKTLLGGTAPQRVCCLAMCGIHLGPLRYLNTSSLVQPYLQYFESAAARELFEFQDSESQVARTYVQALSNVLEHGTKFVYVASMNDQVVPIYSGSFTTAAHPLLLRALYIDGEAYSSSDFLSNLLVLLLRIRNAGLDDGGLLTHLSEATAGSLSGVGHSSAYEEPATYALAVRFLFETSGALGTHTRLDVQTFTARAARNDYEIPWALRDVIANPDVAALFASEFAALRAAFDEWHPRTTILRELRRKLEPIRRLASSRL